MNRRRFIHSVSGGIASAAFSTRLEVRSESNDRVYPVGHEEDYWTVRPGDSGEALVNPDMGWTMHFYSDIPTKYGSRLAPSDTLDDFPGLSTVYLRVPWAFLEPQEGRFDWSLIDTPAQRWIDKGKRIALCVTATESWMQYATPEWVRRAGARGYDFTPRRGIQPDGIYWEPAYDDPVFLEKLEGLVAALGRRYDANRNVAFVDVGSIGVWGEGHTVFSSGVDVSYDTQVRHIDLHLKYFPNTLLCISDDYAGHDAPGVHFPITDYALSKGVTLRDDSILVQAPPKSWFHADLAGLFWPHYPVILEHEHYGTSVQRGAWHKDLWLKAVEDYHASYMSIHWWPRELLEPNRDIIEVINRRLGYRLQLQEAAWPKEIRLGEPFEVCTRWANAGVAPCYPGGFMALTIKDERGGLVSVHVDESLDMRTLHVAPPGEAEIRSLRSGFTLARAFVDRDRWFSLTASPGNYDLFVSVGKRDGTPTIALPLNDNDGLRRYRIGQVRVLERQGLPPMPEDVPYLE